MRAPHCGTCTSPLLSSAPLLGPPLTQACSVFLSEVKSIPAPHRRTDEQSTWRDTHLALEPHQRLVQIFHLHHARAHQHQHQHPRDRVPKGAQKHGAEQTRQGFRGEDRVPAKQAAQADVDTDVPPAVRWRTGEEREEGGEEDGEEGVDEEGQLEEGGVELVWVELGY